MKTGLLVAADLYGCAEDSLAQEALTHILEERAKENHMQVQSIRTEQENETEDGFSCNEEADPEKMVRELCSFLAPDKMKLTYVDRGDFGKKADMKPRHRNKSRKITQMRNMTKRFGKLLMKPKSL